ncbi:hypothetical protein CLV70_103274 [Pseudosporangium ferrugineum]|uniref:Uncharacterized protein n=2 Tax=Pseudosporangium ferrugineum TaxID=439699 RepID=A0A2T0SD96_9ACTN|nr:hypothetical protein CLV70_103274 [Pseudosporangium ferrugineum]
MSHPWVTVSAMTVGYLLSGVLIHLPVLAVLIAGFIVVASRRARLGPRSTMLARLGLGILAACQVLEVVWLVVLPQLISSFDYRATTYGVLSLIVGILLSLLLAAGLGLLIAAVVTRAPSGDGPFGGSPYEPAPFRPGEHPTFQPPGQPAFQQPGQPAFQQPQQPGQPAFQQPQQSAFQPPSPAPGPVFPGQPSSPPRA